MIFALLGVPTTVFSIHNRKNSEVSIWFTMMCLSNIMWAVLHSLEYLVADEGVALFFQSCKFVFIGAASVFVFYVVLNAMRKKHINNMVILGMLVLPLCTLFVSITDAAFGTTLLYVSKHYEMIDGIRAIVEFKGFWFWVHCVFCYTLLGASIVMMVRYFFRMPKKYRMSVTFLLVGMLLTMAATVVAVLQILPYHFDPGPIAAILAQNFYYFAIFFPHSVDLLMSSREAVFENAAYPILVLDNSDAIVDYNKYAGKVGADAGFSRMKGSSYNEFIAKWVHGSDAEFAEYNPSIFTIHEEKGDLHFEIIESQMYSETQKRKKIGKYVEIKNITPAMMLVHRLQSEAFFDELTGLNNRNYYTRILKEFDKERYFPLGVLVGDLNNLKSVNDTMGHVQGDKLLQIIAGILEECKPPNTTVFRVGGDEFIALTKNADMQSMTEFIERVRVCCEKTEGEGYAMSIALGFQLKSDFSRSIQQVVHEADLAMYRDKHDRRRLIAAGGQQLGV